MGLLKLDAFSTRILQDTKTLLTMATRAGAISLGDLDIILNRELTGRIPKQSSIAESRTKRFKDFRAGTRLLLCDKCGSSIKVAPVNDKPSTQIGGDYKSCIICMNKDCMHVQYFTETVDDLVKRVR